MPTYEITTPDGRTFDVTPPPGTNPTPDEVLAQVKAHVGAAGEAVPPPDRRSWFQKHVSAPVTTGVAKGLALTGETLLAPADIAGSALKALGVIPQTAPVGFDVRGGGMPAAEKAAMGPARLIVPQSGIEAGILAGTALAGPALAALGKTIPAVARAVPVAGQAGATLGQKLAPTAARIGGATAGGAAGGGVTGEGAGKGAALGALAGVLGEGVMWGIGKVARSFVGAQSRISKTDAAEIGKAIGELSDPLKDATTAAELNRLASGEGARKLGAAKEKIVRQIDARVPPFQVLSLGETPMTLREANQKLTEIGQRAFTGRGDPVQAQLYHVVDADIRRALGAADPTGTALPLFAEAQAAYRKGLGLVGLLKPTGSYTKTPGGAVLNPRRLQDYVFDPATQQKLTERLTPQEFQRLVDAVTRGGGLGTRDVLRPMSLNPLSLRNLLLGGGGYGLFGPAGGVAAAVPYVLPNVASTYAGRAPYAASQVGRLAADVLAAKGAGVTQWPQQPTIEDRSRDLERQAEQFRRWRQQYLLP